MPESFQCTCCGKSIDGTPAKIIKEGKWKVLHGPKLYVFEASERFSAYLCEPCTAHWEPVTRTQYGPYKVLKQKNATVITLPSQVREALHLLAGNHLVWVVEGKKVTLKKATIEIVEEE